jgi:hypothetical protein
MEIIWKLFQLRSLQSFGDARRMPVSFGNRRKNIGRQVGLQEVSSKIAVGVLSVRIRLSDQLDPYLFREKGRMYDFLRGVIIKFWSSAYLWFISIFNADETMEKGESGVCIIFTSDKSSRNVSDLKTLCKEILNIHVIVMDIPEPDQLPEMYLWAKFVLIIVLGHGGVDRNFHRYVWKGNKRVYPINQAFEFGVRPALILFSVCGGGKLCPAFRRREQRRTVENRSLHRYATREEERGIYDWDPHRECTAEIEETICSPFLNAFCEVVTISPCLEIVDLVRRINFKMFVRNDYVARFSFSLARPLYLH